VNGRIEKTKKDIEDEKQRLEDINGGALARKTEELEEARAKAFEAKAEFDRHRGGRARLESDLNDARKAAKDAIAPVEKKRAEIRQCEETLRNLQRDQGEHIRAFQDKMPVLLRAIRSHRGFREQPVGPAGTHVRLLKPEWSSILEKALAGPLNSFIVTSKHDQEILSELMRQVDWSVWSNLSQK
jgi:chromosome segregation ATPase